MMELIESEISCGVAELSNLWNPTIADVMDLPVEGLRPAFIVFSDVAGSNGDKLAKLIKKHKLGTLTVTRPKTNPNSGNKIKVWAWSVDQSKFK